MDLEVITWTAQISPSLTKIRFDSIRLFVGIQDCAPKKNRETQTVKPNSSVTHCNTTKTRQMRRL